MSGPDEESIHKAHDAINLPFDSITEVKRVTGADMRPFLDVTFPLVQPRGHWQRLPQPGAFQPPAPGRCDLRQGTKTAFEFPIL